MLTEERQEEARAVLATVERWAGTRADVRAVALVGSWARGRPRMESDVDVVVVVDDASVYVGAAGWVGEAVGEDAPVVRTAPWGELLTERRVRLRSGLEIEFGFALPGWARPDPVDPGTAGVVRDGCRAVYDPEGIIGRLIAAVPGRH